MEISQKNWTHRVPPFKVIGTDMGLSAIYDFLLMIHSNHGPVSYRLRDKRRFWSKIANFTDHCGCNAPSRKFPLGFCNAIAAKKLESCHFQIGKEFDSMCIDTILACDRHTDRFATTVSRSTC